MNRFDRWANQKFGRWTPLFGIACGAAGLAIYFTLLVIVLRALS